MPTYAPFTDDNGRPAGYVVTDDDGDRFMADLAGTITGVWDAAAQNFVAAEPGWTVNDLPGFQKSAEDPRLAAVNARLDRYEQALGLGDQPAGGGREYDPELAQYEQFLRLNRNEEPEEEYDPELAEWEAEQHRQHARAMQAENELERAGQVRGGDFDRVETEAILERYREDPDAGINYAIERTMAEQPEAIKDLETREGRRRSWAQKIEDGPRNARLQPLGAADPVANDAPNLDNHEERWQAMGERLNGSRTEPLTETPA